MKWPPPSSPPTFAEALRIARDLATNPDTLVPYPHQGLENARFGQGFAFLETVRTDQGDTDGYVLVTTTAYGGGLLSMSGHTIDTAIAEHLARAEHSNRDIPDSELSTAHRVAIEAYDTGLTRIDEVPGRATIDAATSDYAEFVLIGLRNSRNHEGSARNILAHNDFLMRSPTPGRRYTQPCPHCGRPTAYDARYARAVCVHCRSRTTDHTGRRVTGYNVDLSGGMIAYYADSIDDSGSPKEEWAEGTRTGVCFIDGRPATMKEARFGGIVVEAQPPPSDRGGRSPLAQACSRLANGMVTSIGSSRSRTRRWTVWAR